MRSDRAKMIAASMVTGACFAIGIPAIAAGNWALFLPCYLISLPASMLVGRYSGRANRDGR